MIDDIDYTLLAGYLAGECSADEADRVRVWLAASPENAAAFREFEAFWQAAPRAAATWDVDDAWHKVRRGFRDQPRLTLASSESAAATQPQGTAPRRMGPRFLLSRSGLWAAAVAVLLLGTSAVILGRTRVPVADQTTQLPMREVATAKGQRTSIRLNDGTQVVLGVDSKLHFPSAFGVTARDVYLDGEAFFDVTHDPDKPFVVHAAGSVTRVLGTKFSVRAYAGGAGVRVAVVEGRVRLRPELANADDGVVLTRNQLGRLDPDGRLSIRRDVNVQSYLGWVSGQIVFEDAPLHEVLGELEHWYNADLVVTDPSLDSLRFTAAFREAPLDVVVQAIARTLDLQSRRTGSAVVFFRRSRSDQ